MINLQVLTCAMGICLIFPLLAFSQTDEIRQATGFPIPIGAPVIYGQVTLRGLTPNERRPSVFVSLLVGGTQVDRRQTNDAGYYYFLTKPADGATLVFEANGSEVGRVVLTAGTGSSVRQDVSLDWSAAKQATSLTPGVISVKDAYSRSPADEKEFEKAMEAVREKRKDALPLFRQIVEKDPKDFVGWTELGSLYFSDSKSSDAETAYNKALSLKPDFMPALMNLGKLYLSQKNFENAISVLFKAVSSDNFSADAFHYLGEAYLGAKQGSKAVIALNEAIRLAPIEMAEIHLRLAALYNAAGAKDRAANEYKLFLEKKPTYPDRQKLEEYIKANAK